MQFLRRIPTPQLLGLCAAVVALGLAVTAIAIAATGGGPTPPQKPLAEAVHDALTAPQVSGASGRVEFTNRLISDSQIEGTNPLLTGANGRFWAAKDGRLRIELQSDASGSGPAGDVQILVDRGRFTVLDSANQTAYVGTLPPHRGEHPREHRGKQPPSVARIQKAIDRAGKRANVSGAEPTNVAGQPAYTVNVSPKQNGGLFGGIELSWDAEHGVPLRGAVFARGDSSPVLELKATDISYGDVPNSVFQLTPPPGTKIEKIDRPEGAGKGEGRHPRGHRRGRGVTGLDAVQKRVGFKIVAPDNLGDMPLSEVKLVGHGKRTGALVTYGEGLGGIAVAQLPVDPKKPMHRPAANGDGEDKQGLTLPTIQVNGVTADKLETPLGTVIRFRRGGVQYIVAGSVPAAVAEAAARGL